MKKKYNLITAIVIAHRLKDGRLDVVDHGRFATWDASQDVGWLQYRRVMDTIYSKSKLIYKMLKWAKYI